VDSGEEIPGEFVIAGGDGAKVLELVEEALDEVTFAIEYEVAVPRSLAIGGWRNHRTDLPPVERLDQPVGIVSLVPNQSLRIDVFDQRLCASQIVGLPGREPQHDGVAKSIDQRVDFGGQSAAGSADRLLAVFFRAPALCW
jgi:hypothetical protein